MNESQILYLACEEIMKHIQYFENKEFVASDVDQCIEEMKKLIAKKYITLDWCNSVANAVVENKPIWINLDLKWHWTFLCGQRNQSHEDFMDNVKMFHDAAKKGKIKSKYGKDYFNKKNKE